MKKLGVLFLLTVSFIGIASAASSTGVNVFVGGCHFLDSSGNWATLLKNQCSEDGYHFCDSSGLLLNTYKSGYGCSRGKTAAPILNSCCGEGDVCALQDDGTFKCELSMTACNSDLPKDKCSNASGVFYNGRCVCKDGQGCRVYANQSDCTNDSFNFGENGDGSISCDSGDYVKCSTETYIKGCECSWKGDNCSLSQVYTNTDNGKQATCFHSQDFGNCTDGEREIKDTVSFDNGGTSCNATDIGCDDGAPTTHSIECGKPSVRVPGFSLFSFVFSLFLIGMYYSLKMIKFK